MWVAANGPRARKRVPGSSELITRVPSGGVGDSATVPQAFRLPVTGSAPGATTP